jgi:hypothetical protein
LNGRARVRRFPRAQNLKGHGKPAIGGVESRMCVRRSCPDDQRHEALRDSVHGRGGDLSFRAGGSNRLVS